MLSTQDLSNLESHFHTQKNVGEKDTSTVRSQTPSIMGPEPVDPTDKKLDVSPSPKLGWRFLGAFACLCVINFICAIDATILAVALPVCVTHLLHTSGELTKSSFRSSQTPFKARQ
jgi:hypothetical protein